MIVGPHPACDSLLHLSQIVPLILALPFMPNRFVESLDKGVMSRLMDEEIKRWTARRKTALVLDIIQGKTTVAEASRAYDLTPSEVESWVEDGKKGMENALKANPLDIHSQYERQIKDLQEAYGEAMLELRARKKLQSLLDEAEK